MSFDMLSNILINSTYIIGARVQTHVKENYHCSIDNITELTLTLKNSDFLRFLILAHEKKNKKKKIMYTNEQRFLRRVFMEARTTNYCRFKYHGK